MSRLASTQNPTTIVPRPDTHDNIPYVGAVPERSRHYIIAGHNGHGMVRCLIPEDFSIAYLAIGAHYELRKRSIKVDEGRRVAFRFASGISGYQGTAEPQSDSCRGHFDWSSEARLVK